MQAFHLLLSVFTKLTPTESHLFHLGPACATYIVPKLPTNLRCSACEALLRPGGEKGLLQASTMRPIAHTLISFAVLEGLFRSAPCVIQLCSYPHLFSPSLSLFLSLC